MHLEQPNRLFASRGSSRLQQHDYSSRGMYFVTVCTRDRERLFGSVAGDRRITSTDFGRIVDACWVAIPAHVPGVVLDAWVTMPNHLHGILILREETDTGDTCVQAEACVPGRRMRRPYERRFGRKGPASSVDRRNRRFVQIRCNEANQSDPCDSRRGRLATQLLRLSDPRSGRSATGSSLHPEQSDSVGIAEHASGRRRRVRARRCLAPTNVWSRTNRPAHRRE